MTTPGTCPEGHRNDPAAAYCQECGSAISSAPDVTSDAPLADRAVAAMPTSPAGAVASMPAGGSRRRGLLLSGIVVGALAVVGGIAATFILLGGTEVPSVVGMTPAQAEKTLTDAGFTTAMGDKVFSSTVLRGQVESQEPAAGEKAGGGSAIRLYVSRGPARIAPDLVGASLSAARSEAKDADLALQETREVSSTVAAGEVMSQDPTAGAELEAGGTVTVVVSSGPPSTTVEYSADLGSFALREEMLCSFVSIFWPSTYKSAVIVNGNGTVLSTNSGWREAPGNGNYFPCVMTTTFPNVSTEEEEYQVWYSKSDPKGNQGQTYSRSQMELADWNIDE